MATFTVDPATLHGLSSTLTDIHGQMQNMHGVAEGYEGLLGGGDLESKVEDFCSHWGYGITKLNDHMGKVVTHLDYAADGYGTSEQNIVNAAKGGH